MPKTHSQTRITDNKGNARIASYCANHNPQITWRKIIDDDIGIDGEIEIYDQNYHPLAEIIKVQLKSTESDTGYIKNESEKHDNFTFYAEKSHVEYWQNLPNDVLLIVFDGRNNKEDLYAKRIEGFDLAKIKTKDVPIVFNKKTDYIHEKNNDFHARFSRSLGEKSVLQEKFLPNFFIPNLDYFVGRENLFINTEKELKTSHRVSIHDISGLGKTFSTLEYARRNQNKYDQLFFINASKETYLESLAECGVLLDKSVANAQEQLVKAQAFTHWLEKNNNWLVIFDNVDVAKDILPFVPTNKQGDCLFTSNFPDVEELGTVVKIEKLSQVESQTLLFSRKSRQPHQKPTFTDQIEQDSFDKIIEEIDGLPISLTTTGAFIAKKQINFAEYLQRLEETPDIILEAEDDFGTYHKKSALKAFSIAFEANTDTKGLAERDKQIAEAVKTLYFVASFLYPEDIHEEFLRAYLENEYERLGKAKMSNSFWQDVRVKMTEYDLFKWNPHNKTFWTHRLIQKTIQTKQTTDEKEAICRDVLDLLFDFFPEYDYNNKESCERYYQHTVFALENADKLFESEDSDALYYRVAYYQELLGNYLQAESYYQRNLEISKIVYGIEHKETATSLNNLALVYQAQGKYDEAIKLFQEALEISKKTIGTEHPNYAIRLNNLAGVYYVQGKYDEAIKFYKEALKISKKTIGTEHPNYAGHLNNLAGVYYEQGKYNEAIKLFQEALEISKKTIGTEHPDYAIRLNNLANVYNAQGKYDEAIKLYQEALEIDKKILGTEHPDYAIDLHNLANVYYSQGKYQDALPLYEEALRIREAKLPETHHYIQDSREYLRICQMMLGIKDE
jgi:tetratricopeptide (TPR) repeat protein/dsDNA-binding SOS-regulon protein